jgi:hypothetical protein
MRAGAVVGRGLRSGDGGLVWSEGAVSGWVGWSSALRRFNCARSGRPGCILPWAVVGFIVPRYLGAGCASRGLEVFCGQRLG